MSMETHDRMTSTGENSLFIHQSYLVVLPAESFSSKAGGTGEKIMNLALSLLIFRRDF
jgi:hypothetical protein